MARPMRRGLFLAAALLASVLLLLVAAHGIVRSVLSEDVVAQWVSDALGREVEIESVSLRLVPRPRVRLAGISVAPDHRIELGEVELQLLPLIRRELRLAGIRVEGSRVGIERRADGSLALAGDAPAPTDAAPPLPPFSSLVVRDAAIAFIDRTAGGSEDPVAIEIHELEVRNLGPGETATFRGSARIGESGARGSFRLTGRAGPLGKRPAALALPLSLKIETTELDPALVVPYLPTRWLITRASGALDADVLLTRDRRGDFEGTLSFDFGSGTVTFAGIDFGAPTRFETEMSVKRGSLTFSDASVQARSASFRGYLGHDLRAAFGYAQRTLAFDSLEFEALYGTWRQKGSIAFLDETMLDFEVRLSDVDVERYAAGPGSLGPARADPPRLDAEATVRGRWTSQGNWLAPLEVAGKLSVRGGELPDFRLLHSVGGPLTQALPRIRRGRPESKGREPPPTRLEQLTASFATEDGRLRTEDLALVSDDFAIKGRGTVGHDQSVDLETKVRFTAQGLEKILVLARVPRVGVRKHRFPPVSVNVAGTLMEPSFSPAAPRILAASFGALAWGAQEAADAAGRAVGAVLDAAGVADAAEPEEDGHESGDDPDPSSE